MFVWCACEYEGMAIWEKCRVKLRQKRICMRIFEGFCVSVLCFWLFMLCFVA